MHTHPMAAHTLWPLTLYGFLPPVAFHTLRLLTPYGFSTPPVALGYMHACVHTRDTCMHVAHAARAC